MKTKKYFINIIALLLFLSCGAASDPPINEAKKLFIKKYIISKDASKIYKVISFNKINSKNIVYPLDNKNAYIVAYMCIIEITNKCFFWVRKDKDYVNMLPVIEYYHFSVKRPSRLPGEEYKTINKGNQLAIQGLIAFRKTEKGWTWLPMDAKEML